MGKREGWIQALWGWVFLAAAIGSAVTIGPETLWIFLGLYAVERLIRRAVISAK